MKKIFMTIKKIFLPLMIFLSLMIINSYSAMAGLLSTSSIVSDDFDRFNLDTPFRWVFENPLKDGWVNMIGADSGDANLALFVPAGQSHDPWHTNRSVRVMQPAMDTDFEIEVRFASEPSLKFQQQGIIVEQDSSNWLRFDLFHDGSDLYVFAASTLNATSTDRLLTNVSTGEALFLRVNRTGDTWTLEYSAGDSLWYSAGSFSQALTVHAVGPFAANHAIGVEEAPAFTVLVDAFFNTAAPITPEDDGAPTDTLAPFIHTIQHAQGADSLTVTWHTDEPAQGTIEYGLSTAYDQTTSNGGGTTFHSLTLTGLVPGNTYHYRILSTDQWNHTSTTADVEFHFQETPAIDIWYGSQQDFGVIGQPQPWVNILGNVSDQDGIYSLKYSLNSGSLIDLTVGPDFRRLAFPGDFNIDLATADLFTETLNTVVITATDTLGNPETETVTVSYQTENIWPLPYSIDWGALASDGDPNTPDTTIQTVAQVVDGKWSLDGDAVRTVDPQYDRLLNIGEMTWEDYEVTVPITIHSVISSDFGVGFLTGWKGHTDDPVICFQPKCGWLPLGALGWITQNGIEFYDTGVNKYIPISTGTSYWMKLRTESGTSSATYSLKVWEMNTLEPVTWDITYTNNVDPVLTGSLLIMTHMADVSFGDITVYPLSGIPNQPPVALSDTAIVAKGSSVEVEVLLNDYDMDGYLVPDSVTVTTFPLNGSITNISALGTITYEHDNSLTSSDIFTYTVEDDDGATSNEISVNIDVNQGTPSVFASDDFNTCSLDPVWSFIDPLYNSSYEVLGAYSGNAQLAITVPQGSEHQLWTDGPTVARMMQPATDGDFDLEVKFDSLLTEQYQEQGIVIQGTNGDFLRLEFFSDAGGTIMLYVAVISDYTQVGYHVGAVLPNGLPPYMRITRSGDNWTQYISTNGNSWTANANFHDYNHPMTVTYVGVYAGNALGLASPAHTALVDYFSNNAAPSADEDGGRNTLTVNTVGQGSVLATPISSNYACATSVSVDAQADEGWFFSTWSGDLTGSITPESLIMDSPKIITATFTTNPVGGQIIIIKQTDPDGSLQSFDFNADYTESFQLTDGQSHNSGELAPGTYSVSENSTAGWSLASATCDNGNTPDSILLVAGETVTCTFTNEFAYHLYLPIILKQSSTETSQVNPVTHIKSAGNLQVMITLLLSIMSIFLR